MMVDQPIPQEVDPVRGLVEAVKEACDLLAERTYGNPARSAGHNARLTLETALATYRAWEEGGGSDSARVWMDRIHDALREEDPLSPRQARTLAGLFAASPPPPASAPPEGWRLVPVVPTPEMLQAEAGDWECTREAIWDAMISAAPDHPASSEDWEMVAREALRPFADAFRDAGGDLTKIEREAVQRHSVEYDDFRRAAVAFAASPPPPAGVDRPETEGEGELAERVRVLEAGLRDMTDPRHMTALMGDLSAEKAWHAACGYFGQAALILLGEDRADALLAQQKERG